MENIVTTNPCGEYVSGTLDVNDGKDYMGAFNFICENEVNSIEYISWSADYDSFWGTYKIWFIATLVIVLVASLIYIIL